MDMTIPLLVVLGLLVAAVVGLRKKQPGAMRAVVAVLCLVAIAMVVMNSLYQAKPGPEPGSETRNRHWLASAQLGRMLADDLAAGGKVLVVQMPSESGGGAASLVQSQLDGLKAGYVGTDVEFISVQPVVGEDDSPMAAMEALTLEEFQGALDAHADAVACVSFLDLPLGELGDTKVPPVYAMDVVVSGLWKPALESGLVRAVVVPKPEAPMLDEALMAQDPDAAFENLYMIERAPESSP